MVQKSVTTKESKRTEGYISKIVPRTVLRVRQDIAKWKMALQQADNVLYPRRVRLQYLYKDILLDALLSSQLDNRCMITKSSPFSLCKDGELDVESSRLCRELPWFTELIGHIIDSQFFGTTLVEFITDTNSGLKPVLLPRQNIVPVSGMLLLDETDTSGIDFRNAKEYGTWLLEFGNPDEYGRLNKAVPHVLFKRFAQSCWSELCEIYGIPPRVMKTNTQDTAMLNRAEQMMSDMGAAAWFIIDENESFDFAKGADTNGDVYSNLIRFCNNELSMLITGAIIGQDTKNGNESKEKVSVGQLMRLAEADKRYVEGYMNTVVLPALFKIGMLPEGLKFDYDPQENTDELYTRTIGFMQYMDVDPDWVKTKFGIEVTGIKQTGGSGANFQQAPA
ncbi:MAG: DUF935 family protein [Bacteroidota bacterium]